MIQINKYYNDLIKLENILKTVEFDYIVALKRSGWIMGVYLSNKLIKPLFTVSEIKSIPDKNKTILIVDDKICTGKSINKVKNKLKEYKTFTACLYIESDKYADYYIEDLKKTETMWYENF